MKAVVSQAAHHDLAVQSGWYAHYAGEDIAERYLESFQLTLGHLSFQPDLGHPRHFRDSRLKGLRSMMMHGAFRVHLIFYRLEGDTLVVFRVLHGMRDLKRRLLMGANEE